MNRTQVSGDRARAATLRPPTPATIHPPTPAAAAIRPTSPAAPRPASPAAAAIRPTSPADLPALGEFFAGLSAQTRYLRFFGPVTPGPAMLSLLIGAGARSDALIAVRAGVIIGHAMAVDQARPGGSPLVTDIGVVVADAWQGRGIGSALTRALTLRARARGVTSATMDVLPHNRRALAMITGHWPTARITHSRDGSTVSCPLTLPPPPVSLQWPSTRAASCPDHAH